MADEKISLELFIEADKASMTLGDLEQGFEQMKEQLKQVGRGSEEFKTLSTAMAQTSKEIKNIELGFEGLDREQVASELGSVAGAVGDLTASFVLLGGESETMEQIGRNIEKAIAISMGLKGAIEGIASAQKLWTNLVKQSEGAQKLLTLATKGWGKALIATGIGAIIALVATLITKWDDLTVAIGMSTKEQKLNNQVTQEAIDKVADEISASDKLQKTLNDESISREEKNKAIIELQDEYPNLLSNIDAEKDSIEDINKALVLNTQLLTLRAKQEAIASLRADEFKEQIKAQADAQTGANVGLFESVAGLTTQFTAQEFANAKSIDAIKTSKEQVTVLDELNDTIQKEIDLLLEAGAVGEDER
jgi:RNase H-fold protein (predicted Holliday junction resolvase)